MGTCTSVTRYLGRDLGAKDVGDLYGVQLRPVTRQVLWSIRALFVNGVQKLWECAELRGRGHGICLDSEMDLLVFGKPILRSCRSSIASKFGPWDGDRRPLTFGGQIERRALGGW